MNDGSFAFKPAARENTPLIVGLSGASGSGKTFTALELAAGLAGEQGRIAIIDTEGRRSLLYADLPDENGKPRFRFDHCDLRSPYTPQRFLGALKAAEAAGYSVIIVDSFSDEYIGEGGLVDMAAAERSPNEAAKWAKPKAQHKLVVRWFRQCHCHVLVLMRAEEKVKLEKVTKDGKEQTAVIPIGWQPICEKNTPYDMTVSFMLTPDAPGIPRPIKLPEQFKPYFPGDRPITRESGRAIAAWAAAAPAPRTPEPVEADPSLEVRVREAAANGVSTLNGFVKSLSDEEWDQVSHLIGTRDAPGELLLIAREVDRLRVEHKIAQAEAAVETAEGSQ